MTMPGDGLPDPGPPQPAPHTAWTTAGLLLFSLLSPLPVVQLEWHTYHAHLDLLAIPFRQAWPLVWVLYVKTLLLLLPAILLAVVLTRHAWRKTAVAIF